MKEERLIDALARRVRAACGSDKHEVWQRHMVQAQKLLDTATKEGYTHPNSITLLATRNPGYMCLSMTHSDTEARVLRLENTKRHEFYVPFHATETGGIVDCGFQEADACALADLEKVLFHTKIPLE